MNKRLILIVALLLSISLFCLPVFASTRITATYADGIVTVSGTDFIAGTRYTTRIINTTTSSVTAMKSVTAEGDGAISADITTGVLETLSNYIVRINNSEGLLMASCPINQLSSIAITTPATKLSYTVGDTLDLSGLVVTGTNIDNSTQVETVAAANVTGFNSSAPVVDQVLTITIDGKTTTYTVDIYTATVPGAPTAVSYIVTFMNGSTVEAISNVVAGSTITEPAAPTKAGFNFSGWFKNAGYTTAWNFASDTVTANTTLHAKWTDVYQLTVPNWRQHKRKNTDCYTNWKRYGPRNYNR